MLSPEDKRALHRLENDLLIEEEKMRHLALDERRITQEEHSLRSDLLRTQQAIEHNKAEKGRIKQLLTLSEEAVQRLKIKLKGLRN